MVKAIKLLDWFGHGLKSVLPGVASSRVGSLPQWLAATASLLKHLWRGDLAKRRTAPLGCEAAPNQTTRCASKIEVVAVGAAAQPSGDKSPRHGAIVFLK